MLELELEIAEAILSCFLAWRLEPGHPKAVAYWSVTTLVARAVEEARKATGLDSYAGLDLRKVRLPETRPPFQPGQPRMPERIWIGLAAFAKETRCSRLRVAGRLHAPRQETADPSLLWQGRMPPFVKRDAMLSLASVGSAPCPKAGNGRPEPATAKVAAVASSASATHSKTGNGQPKKLPRQKCRLHA